MQDLMQQCGKSESLPAVVHSQHEGSEVAVGSPACVYMSKIPLPDCKPVLATASTRCQRAEYLQSCLQSHNLNRGKGQSNNAIRDLMSDTTHSKPSIRPAPVTALHATIRQCRVPIASKSSTCSHSQCQDITAATLQM